MRHIRTQLTRYELWAKLAFTSIAVFVLYSFWFQQVYHPIGGAFTFLGVIFLALILLNLRRIRYFKELYPFFAFMIIVALETFLFAKFRQSSMQMLFMCLEYLLPAVMIFLYVDGDKRKLDQVLTAILMAVTFLSVGSFIRPVKGNTGAISVGTLNVNVFSSFLLLGLISACVLYFRKRKKTVTVFLLVASTLINTIAQINTASRRGFLVYVFVICFVLWQSLRIQYHNKPIVKISLALFLVVLGAMMAGVFLEQFGDSALVSRLLGHAADTRQGDRMRAVYQAGALKLFLKNPLTGAGLNGVTQTVGVYSHSLYFELLGCTGIIGTIPLLYFLFSSIYFFYRKSKVDVENSHLDNCYMAMNGMAFCLAILITGYAVVLIYDMYFYIMIAIIASLKKCMSVETFESRE